MNESPENRPKGPPEELTIAALRDRIAELERRVEILENAVALLGRPIETPMTETRTK